jgi:hypothetical protein
VLTGSVNQARGSSGYQFFRASEIALVFFVLLCALLVSPLILTAEEPAIAIADKEYVVFSSVMKQYHDAALSSIGKQTMKVFLDAKSLSFLKEQGMPIDEAMANDFNAKNRRSYDIDQAFISKHAGRQFREGGRDNIVLSRVGFDTDGTRALISLKFSHVHGEAFYQEELFLLLELKADSCVIIKKVKAGLKYY